MNALTMTLAIALALSPRQHIDDVLTAAGRAGAGGVLLVRRGERVLYQRAWGAGLTADLFDIGSITKVMTAVAVLHAVEEGKLSLGTRVGDVFRSAPEPIRSMTVQQLLTHRSGLADSLGLDETLINRTFFLAQLFATKVEPLPEGQTRYSNAAYSLLAAMLEERTGARFEAYVRRHVFAPAGVDIGYSIDPDKRRRLVRGTLRGMPWGSTADYFGPGGPSWYLLGNGGFIASARDLDRWFDALWNDKLLRHESTELIRAALTRHDKSGRRILFSSGANTIFSSQYERWPDDDAVVILLTSHSEWPKEKLMPELREAIAEIVAEPRR
jgi:CubicO group peptidase (beta-lactamase class C family)